MQALLISMIMGALVVGVKAPVAPVHSAATDTITSTEKVVTIKIDITTGHIVMPTWIAGDGPYWFVLDTGNQNTTIFAHVAENAGLDTEPMGEMGGAGSGSVTVRRAIAVPVGIGEAGTEIRFEEPTVTVLPDAAQLPDFNGKQIAGFLGTTLIERAMTSVDYGAGELVLSPREDYRVPGGAKVLEMKLAFGFPYFEGALTPTLMGKDTEPVAGNYLLDLGATYGLEIDYEDANAIGLVGSDDPQQKQVGQGRGIDGVMFEMRTAPLAQATIGGLELDADAVLFMTTPGGGPPIENLVGAVGSGLFTGGRVTLDYAGGRLIWEE